MKLVIQKIFLGHILSRNIQLPKHVRVTTEMK